MGMMRFTAVAAVVVLAGCAEMDDRVRGSGSGLPEVAMSARTDQVVPPGRWRTGLALRTFVPGTEADSWQEVTGAQCRVTGGDFFTANVVTPVRLVLPDLGPDAPALTAVCTSGTMTGRETVAPAYPWPDEGRPDTARRIAWGGGWWWGMEETGPMAYPDLAVSLR